jgi:hypothetical protein
MARNEKLANSFILFGAMNKFVCLILPIIHVIMQVYHNSGRIPDTGRKMRLRLYIRLRSYILTPVALPDSGRRHNFSRIS